MLFPLNEWSKSLSQADPFGMQRPRYAVSSVAGKLLLCVAVFSGVPSSVLAADEPAPAKESEAAKGEEESELPKRHAYKLGDFRIKDYRPVEREKIKIEFTIYIEVPDGQEQRFERLWKNHEHRVRNQIIIAARLVQSVEYDDPKLHHLRRRIYLRLRRALPELPVGEVFVSDFSYLVD